MTSPRDIHPDAEPIAPRDAELVQRFLDDELTGNAGAAFAKRLQREPSLRAELDRNRALQAELRHTLPFGANNADTPDATAVLDAVFDAPAPPRPFPFRRIAAYAGALAAALVLAVTVRTAVMHASRVAVPVDPARLYLATTRAFEPDIVCDTPEKFIEYTAEHLGPRLTANFDTPVALIGWRKPRGAYGGELPDDPNDPNADPARILLATAPDGTPEGTRIIVVFHEADRPVTEPASITGLNIFERRFGKLTATEVTPLASPMVLELVEPASGR